MSTNTRAVTLITFPGSPRTETLLPNLEPAWQISTTKLSSYSKLPELLAELENRSLAVIVLHSFKSDLFSALKQFQATAPMIGPVIILDDLTLQDYLTLIRTCAEEILAFSEAAKRLQPVLDRLFARMDRMHLESSRKIIDAMNFGFAVGTARLLHDLNSPLTPIFSFMDLTEMQAKKDNRELTSREQMLRSSLDRVHGMSNHWRAYLIGSEPDHEQLDFLEIFHRAANLVQQAFPALQIHLEVPSKGKKEESGIPVLGHRMSMQRIMYEIMMNSAEATAEVEVPLLQVRIKDDDPNWILYFDDNGTGIHGDFHSRYWKDFVTTKKNPGAGLGIGIIKYLVTSNGGDFTLSDNAPLGGATFRLQLRKRRSRIQF